MAKTKPAARAKTPKAAKPAKPAKVAKPAKAATAKTAKTSASAKPAKKAATAKPAKKATTAKPAKTAATKPAATKPKTPDTAATRASDDAGAPPRARRFVGRAAPTPIEALDSTTILGRIVLAARAEEELDDDLPRLLDRLEATLDPSLVPSLFGALDDDDPHGVLWSVFYLLEGLDDHYLRGLVTALPELVARAPRWAETAVLRIVNTRGEPEDCVDALVTIARELKAPARKRLVSVLDKLTKGLDGLHPSQRKTLVEISRAVAA